MTTTNKNKSQGPASDPGEELTEAPTSPANEDPQTTIASLQDNLLRAKADFANLQRRASAERAEAIRFANAELLKSLLNVLDDFDRTIEAAGSSKNLKSVMDGVELVHANLTKSLRDSGLEEINALNEQFDPTIHEALLQQPSDEHSAGTVIEQVARGYRLRDRVLRPAKVIVAKAPDGESANDRNTFEGESSQS